MEYVVGIPELLFYWMKQILSGNPTKSISKKNIFMIKSFLILKISGNLRLGRENQGRKSSPLAECRPEHSFVGFVINCTGNPGLSHQTFWVNIHWRPCIAAIYLLFLLQNKYILFCLLSFNEAQTLTCYKSALLLLLPHPTPFPPSSCNGLSILYQLPPCLKALL